MHGKRGFGTGCSGYGIPLNLLKTGEDGIVVRLNGAEEFRSKMLSLGILPGKMICVTNAAEKQPYILKIDESRVVVDWKTLDKIMVQPSTCFNKKKRWRWGWQNG